MIKIIRILGAFTRGAFKALPMGNAIIEGVKNAKAPAGEQKPHNWISIITQAALVGLIVWAVMTGKIDFDKAAELLGQ